MVEQRTENPRVDGSIPSLATIYSRSCAVNIVAKYGDRVINKGVRRVAPDGKTMRIDVTAIDQAGKETPFFLVFNKVR